MSDGARYRDWERRIRDCPADDLPPGHEKLSMYAVAVCVASYGTNGLGCFAGIRAIASALDCSTATVVKYKKLLKDIGWFVLSDAQRRKGELDIAVPDSWDMDQWRRKLAQRAVKQPAKGDDEWKLSA